MRRALVLGDAACVYDDAIEALSFFKPDAIFATNNIGIHWPGHVDVWCTLHPGPCEDWVGIADALIERVSAGRNSPEIWGHQTRRGITNRTSDWGGSTGLLAVKVALEKGFDRILLAGVPLAPEGGHFYRTSEAWGSANKFRRAWRQRTGWLVPRVKSMSGWTRELLGAPDELWLADTV